MNIKSKIITLLSWPVDKKCKMDKWILRSSRAYERNSNSNH